MKKLKLNVQKLKVESFRTNNSKTESNTVKGHGFTFEPQYCSNPICAADTPVDSCEYTCDAGCELSKEICT